MDDERTLLEILGPRRVEEGLEEAEREIQTTLNARGPFIRTGIERIDYLVDQIRFMKAGFAQAESRGLRGLSALEWTEYLSWPEACRQAGTGWRRDLLHRYAFEIPVSCWQGALYARSRFDTDLPTGLPRRVSGEMNTAIFPSPLVLLGPYPSEWMPTRMAPVSLTAAIQVDRWTIPTPLRPVRRLNEAMTYTIEVSMFRLYNALGAVGILLLDEPRKYSATETRAVLLAMAEEIDSWVTHAARDTKEDVVATYRAGSNQLRSAARRIESPSSRQRADVLESCLTLPGTLWLVAPAVLPDDLPPEWLGLFIGFEFARKQLLSMREKKRLRRVAVGIVESWQARRFARYELHPKAAAEVVERLATIRRLLGADSLFAYLAKAAKGTAIDTYRREADLIDQLRHYSESADSEHKESDRKESEEEDA